MEWMEWIKAALPWLPKDSKIMWDGWGIAVVTGFLGLVGFAFSRLFACFRKPNTASIQHDASEWLIKNRQTLLNRFQDELEKRRDSFLLGRTPLDLDKTLAPDQVDHPHSLWDSIACTLERDNVEVETTDQPIVDLFHRTEVGRRLAILGKPGSGKTVCLLKLLDHLLQEAEENQSAPLPVVFECSEWDGRDLLLWLGWQLHRKYSFPEDTARQLVQAGEIFPLFDGLDELATARQGDFVRRFNAFAADRPLVVCCRVKEYGHLRENSGEKLALSNAVILRDISRQRLKGHLLRTGLDELWNLLEQSEIKADPPSLAPAEEGQETEQPQSLLQLARRPLFLGIMIAVAEDLCQGSGRQPGETEEEFLWRLYLNDCLAPTTPDRNQSPDAYAGKYDKDQSLHWLACLAGWMQAEDKVALQLDELQPTMLKRYWRFGLCYGLFYGLAFGLMGWLFAGPRLGAAVGLVLGLLFGLPGCLPWQWPVKIVLGLAFGLFGWLTNGPIPGLFLGLVFMLIEDNQRIRIDPVRPLRLPASWQDWQAFSTKLATWLVVGLGAGLLFGLVMGLIKAQRLGLAPSLAFILPFMLAGGLLAGLAAGLQAVAGPLNKTAQPQDRLNQALSSSLVLFPLFLLAAMLVFVQILFLAEQLGIAVGPFFKMNIFYIVLFAAAIFSFLFLGTNQVLQHYLLRLCLRLEGQLPLRLIPFLDAVQQRKVLQRVGGSYRFLHKQLQEYLAKHHRPKAG